MTPWDRIGLDIAAWMRLPLTMRIGYALQPFAAWGYTTRSPRVPYRPHRAFPAALVATGEQDTNCSTLTTCLLMAAYADTRWTTEHYAGLQVFETFGPDAPIEAVESAGVADRVEQLSPGCWHLAQGWRSSGTGHAFLLWHGPGLTMRVHAGPAQGVESRPDSIEALRHEYARELHLAALL